MTDYMTPDGARILKDRIAEHWTNLGHDDVQLSTIEDPAGYTREARAIPFIVRSDMLNGYPLSVARQLKRCTACAKWAKAGLPVRCGKCDATEALHAKQPCPNGKASND